MWRIPLFSFEHRAWVLGIAALLTAVSLLVLPRVRLDVSSDGVVASTSPRRTVERNVESRFGRDESLAVYAESSELFTSDRLTQLSAVHDALSSLPWVDRVESLFAMPDVREENGALVLGAPLAEIPADPSALAARLAEIIANPLVRGTIVAADGRATLLRVVPKPGTFDDQTSYRDIELILGPVRPQFDHLDQLGVGATRAAMRKHLKRDQRVILPATAALLFVLLAVGLRSARLAFFPILNGALATCWSLAAMTFLDIPVTLLSACLPALVLVVGGMDDVRIAYEFRDGLRRHGVERLALFETTERIGLATLLNAATTMIGFSATALTDLPVLRNFGIAAGIALGFRFLCTVFLLPAELAISRRSLRGSAVRKDDPPAGSTEGWASKIVSTLVPRVRLVYIGLSIVCVAGIAAAALLPTDNDLLSFLGESDPLVRQTRRAEAALAGSEVLSVALEAAPGEFARAEPLARLLHLTQALRELPGVDAATSLADVVARVQSALRPGNPAGDDRPATDGEVAQLLLFVDPGQLSSLVTPDRASARIVVRTSLHDAAGLEALAGAIGGVIESGRFGRYDHSVGGGGLTLADATRAITLSQASSLAGAALILFTIVSSLFLSIRCGLVAVLVNLVAVMLMFVLMRVLSIPLNIGTCMVASVTLGLVIDDTLHLLVRYNSALRVHRDEVAAIRSAFSQEFRPMVATAAALAGGFAMLGLSEFVPVRQFGLLSAGVVLLGAATECLVSPALFANMRIVTLWDMLALSLRERLLQESPLFAGLSGWQARRLVLASSSATFSAGTTIMRADEPGRTLYVILDGQVEIVRHESDGPRSVARLDVGDVFGEIAVLENAPRTADVIAATDVRTLELTRESLGSLRRFSPFLSSRVLRNLGDLMARRAQSP